ncbi:MAG TPA: metallophosphoesterase [Chthoniobacterales bacterium]|nr:metallophosphoesterase [Chthoniobacterales bacterium]
MLNQLELVQNELASSTDDRRTGGGTPGLTVPQAEVAVAAEELEAARQREETRSTGQRNFDDADPDARRGEEAAPIDDTVFISSDPVISLFQSSLEEYFDSRAEGMVEAKPPADDDRRGTDDFVAITDQKLALSDVLPREEDGRRYFEKFSVTDPRWVASLFAMGMRKFRHRHSFNDKKPVTVPVSNKARLILVGDWGTGLKRAVAVADGMRRIVDEGREQKIEQHVIHLGDVYYSGWEREYRNRFLPHWPIQKDETTDLLTSWCLNGNHDMYCGGHAYFDFLLADPRFARQQRNSFFALRNDYWDIIGLDTAYDDAGLHDPQAEWIAETLAGSNRRSMFLSHHQLFSAYEGPSVALQEKIGQYVANRPADVWFWGHEHRCVFYKDHQGVRNARLIGNGGVPVYMTHREDAEHKFPSFYEYRAFRRRLFEKWAFLGFAVVDLENDHATVRYINEFGTVFRRETLP